MTNNSKMVWQQWEKMHNSIVNKFYTNKNNASFSILEMKGFKIQTRDMHTLSPAKTALLIWLLVIGLQRDRAKKTPKPSPTKYQFVLQEIFIMHGKKSIVVNYIWGLVKVEDGGSSKKTLWWTGVPLSSFQLL